MPDTYTYPTSCFTYFFAPCFATAFSKFFCSCCQFIGRFFYICAKVFGTIFHLVHTFFYVLSDCINIYFFSAHFHFLILTFCFRQHDPQYYISKNERARERSKNNIWENS